MPAEQLPTITIITPSFQQRRFLGKTLDSVLSQRGDFHLDYLVIDGGSTDGSVELLRKYDEKYQAGKLKHGAASLTFRWLSERDQGQASAINKGLRIAQGEILAWLNSDDVYADSQTLAAVLSHFTTQSESKFLYGRGNAIDQFGRVLREESYVIEHPIADLPDLDMILQPATFWRREVYEKIGELNEALHFVLDWEYWLRCREHFQLDFLDRILAHNRIHETTKTSQGGIVRKREIAELLLGPGNFSERSISQHLAATVIIKEQVPVPWTMRSLAGNALKLLLAPGRYLETQLRTTRKRLFAKVTSTDVAIDRQLDGDIVASQSNPSKPTPEPSPAPVERQTSEMATGAEASRSSYSQVGQDVWVIGEVFNRKRGGFFLEIGAADGITLSNTYLLETAFDWQGICVEANPESYKKLAACRKAWCVHTCLDSAPGEVEFAVRNLLGGIIGEGLDNSQSTSSPEFEVIRIPTRPLEEVLEEASAPSVIDYLSLDVEGAEERVLAQFPFEKYLFRCMTIERPNARLRGILSTAGYVIVKELSGLDTFYVHSTFHEEYLQNVFTFWENSRVETLLKKAA